MTITSHPLQNESAGQLGKVKSNARPYIDADTQLRAEQWNAAAQRLIEVHNEVGLTDGSEPGTHAARIKNLEEAVPGPGPLSIGFSDLLEAATGEGWSWSGDHGDAALAGSLTANGFPSLGAALLHVNAGGDFKEQALLFRAAHGMNVDSVVPLVAEYRLWLPQGISGETLSPDHSACLAYWGLGAGFADEGPATIIAWGINDGGFFLATTNGDPEDPTFYTCHDVPVGEVLQARITVTAAQIVIDVSNDDGASYVRVCETGTPPPALGGTYFPVVFLSNDGPGSPLGDRVIAIDWFRSVSARAGDGASPWSGENSFPFPGEPARANDDNGQIQSVGGSNQAGTSDRFARADHVHSGGAVPTPGSSTQDVGTSNGNGSADEYARTDHVHRLTAATVGTLLASLSTAVLGDGSGDVQLSGTSVTVHGTGAAALVGNTDGNQGSVAVNGFGDVEVNALTHISLLAASGANVFLSGHGGQGTIELTDTGALDFHTGDGLHIGFDTGIGMHSNEIYDVTNVRGDGTNPIQVDGNGQDVQLNGATVDASGTRIKNVGTPTTVGDAIPLGFLSAGSYAPTFYTPDASVTTLAKVVDWSHATIGGLHVVIGELTLNTTNSGSAFRPFFDVDMPSTVTTIRGAFFTLLNQQTVSAAVGGPAGKITLVSGTKVRVQMDYQAASGNGFRAFVVCAYE